MSVYPGPGDKAFSGQPEIEYGMVMLKVTGIDRNYVLGFKHSGDTLVEEIVNGDMQVFDYTLAIPACYLYRHYLELHLKWILRMATRLGHLALDKAGEKTMKEHDLLSLWKLTKGLITDYFKDADSQTLESTEQIIKEFHLADESGTELRYDTDNRGKPTLQKMPADFSLVSLRQTIGRVYLFLDGYSTPLTFEFD